jgi:hypothetical protein
MEFAVAQEEACVARVLSESTNSSM